MVKGRFVPDVKTDTNVFKNFFVEQCTPLNNDKIFSACQIFLTESRLCSLDCNEDEILKKIRDLNIHKAYGHDDTCARMIRIYDKSLLQPLVLLFHNLIKSSCYPDIWRGSNVIPVHKKSDKQLAKNCWSISFLPILGKTFEKDNL